MTDEPTSETTETQTVFYHGSEDAAKYCLVHRATGLVETILLWDGQTDYTPHDDYLIVPWSDDLRQGIGDTIDPTTGEILTRYEPPTESENND